MVSLSDTKSKGGGLVKKMIHVPTMTLQTVREIPIQDSRENKAIKKSIKIWKEDLSETPEITQCLNYFWNESGDSLSIVAQHMAGDSLKSMLSSCGFLLERDIRNIALACLKVFISLSIKVIFLMIFRGLILSIGGLFTMGRWGLVIFFFQGGEKLS